MNMAARALVGHFSFFFLFQDERYFYVARNMQNEACAQLPEHKYKSEI